MLIPIATATFDYGTLDAESRIVVRQKTDEIRDRVKRAAQDIVAIGERLIAVKEQLGHGQFGAWLDKEFGWDHKSAQRMMCVATTFKNDNLSNLKIGPSALYLLASPSTPEDVRSEIIEEAKAGKPITHAEVKDRVAAAKTGPELRDDLNATDPLLAAYREKQGAKEDAKAKEDLRGADDHEDIPALVVTATPKRNTPEPVAAKREPQTFTIILTNDPAAVAATLAGRFNNTFLVKLAAELQRFTSGKGAA